MLRTALYMVALLLLAASARADEAAGLTGIVLKDGQTLIGHLEESDGKRVLVLPSGARLELREDAIESMRADVTTVTGTDGKLWHADPNRTRYLYAPSAIMLHAGEGYFSQKELIFSAVAVGVSDHLTLLAGSVVRSR